MKQQTAVEFISKGLFDILQEAENNNILEIGTQNFKRYIEMFEQQAKAMEKEQIEEALLTGLVHWNVDKPISEYYNETFKSE